MKRWSWVSLYGRRLGLRLGDDGIELYGHDLKAEEAAARLSGERHPLEVVAALCLGDWVLSQPEPERMFREEIRTARESVDWPAEGILRMVLAAETAAMELLMEGEWLPTRLLTLDSSPSIRPRMASTAVSWVGQGPQNRGRAPAAA